jgi:hypothetical protein
MKSEDLPSPAPNQGSHASADTRLQALMLLKERLQELHAELEYTRLMLKVKRPGG